MTRQQLIDQIKEKESFLCVGLDSDIQKIPQHLLNEKDPLFEFNKQIIDATYKYAVAYKPNIAFYESLGSKGWKSLEKTMEYMPKDVFSIADAKRGDIGNTSSMYARAFFENMDFDSITVAPYMGSDSVQPFLGFDEKWVILLAATSNPGALDFQQMIVNDTNETLFEIVIRKSSEWGDDENLMYVVGATRPELLKKIRQIIPHHFLLIPGVGAQGGSLSEVCKYGMTNECGLLINSSRGIIYADDTKDFANTAAKEAQIMQIEMAELLSKI
jgi:orotidine-5'-phosphate decarboxylase